MGLCGKICLYLLRSATFMIDINFDELDDKTKLIVSKMEKVIENKNSTNCNNKLN